MGCGNVKLLSKQHIIEGDPVAGMSKTLSQVLSL